MFDAKYYSVGRRARQLLPKDFPEVVRLLDLRPGIRVLDVGCGLGVLSAAVADAGTRVLGIDVSDFAIEEARMRYADLPSLEFRRLNALELDFHADFDRVLCYHVYEHFDREDRRRVLSRIRASLKPGGSLVLGVPVNDFLHHPILRSTAAVFGIQVDPTHRVNFSLLALLQELEEGGFLVEAIHRMFYFDLVRLPNWVYSVSLVGRYLLGGVNVRCIHVG